MKTNHDMYLNKNKTSWNNLKIKDQGSNKTNTNNRNMHTKINLNYTNNNIKKIIKNHSPKIKDYRSFQN